MTITTYLDAWFGTPEDAGLSDALAPHEIPWDGTHPPGGIPRMLPEERLLFDWVRRRIAQGDIRWRHVDELRCAVLLTHSEIMALTEELYGEPGRYEAQFDGQALSHLADRMRAFRTFLGGLPRDRLFALNASEF
ncbi:hypothetical protein [Roseomonas populi]|uniref:DUF924 domain-containing protein n=1 Tax=Roseomonas populi TaxID=3121582 RepID=A0ABT1X792_9PROT|nr:hypothetical protein [Roseomonas pecuniae]MCR0983574.1 hypothetical protein [Roseomonas pecuniae]